MSVLRTIESKIEGLFEGLFGRAFRTHVQPVELARKLAKEMDEHRSVSVSRVYVPNEYTIYLSSSDRQQFASYEGSLIGELQEYLTEHARREAYALLTPPGSSSRSTTTSPSASSGSRRASPSRRKACRRCRVAARTRPERLDPGRSRRCRGRRSDRPSRPGPRVGPVDHDDLPGARLAADASAEAPPAPEPPREVVTITLAGHAHPITSRSFVIGRSRECDLRVTDGNASRRHAEIAQEGSVYVLVDLGSTNGTELNGRRVTRQELADGDRITIGATDLVFGRSSS